MQLFNIILILLSLFNFSSSFDLGLWKGYSHYYLRTDNNFDFNKPVIFTYNNYSNNFNKSLFHNHLSYTRLNTDNPILNLKFMSYDKLSGVIAKIDKTTNNFYYFSNQINFFYNSARSIISINYTYNNQQQLQLNTIIVTSLRCSISKVHKIRPKLTNLTSLKNKRFLMSLCKSTIIDAKYPFNQEENHIKNNNYYYDYLFINNNRICKIFIDNLIVSIPEIIDTDRPFTLVFACLLTNDCYKQINLNYNFNGHLKTVEFNEYETFNFTTKLNDFLRYN